MCSPSAGEMFSSCAGASVINHAYHRFLASHTTVTSPCLGNVTSCIAVAVAAVIAITIVAIATVATTPKAPCSDGHSLQDGDIALPEVPEVEGGHVMLCGRGPAMSAIGILGWNG